MTNVQVTNLYDLQDRRIMMEKKLPPYGYALLLIVAALMIGLVAWSTVTPRIYISQLQGSVQSANKTYIMSSYSGQITELNISEGSYVEQGDLIAHIKSTDIDIQQSQLENQLEQNQSELEQLYYSALQSAAQNVSSVQANIESIQSQLDALSTGANDYYIYAPTSGVIHMDTPYSVGMVLSAGSVLATVASENADYEIVAYAGLSDRPLLDVGDPCTIAITGLAQTAYGTLTGTVTAIDSDVTTSNGTSFYKVTVKPDSTYLISKSGDQVDLANGMSVTARVQYDEVTYFQYALEALGVLTR